MSSSSLFRVNGVSACARVNAAEQTSTISHAFAARCRVSDWDDVVISAPVGDQNVSSSVAIRIADHMHDVTVGVDWMRCATRHRFGLSTYDLYEVLVLFLLSDVDLKGPSSLGIGFQYSSGYGHTSIVPAGSSSGPSSQLDNTFRIRNSLPADRDNREWFA